jgi:hypothetical protein
MPLIEFKRAGQGEREGEDQENVGLLDLAIDRVCIYVHGFPNSDLCRFLGSRTIRKQQTGKKTRTH